MPIFSSPYSGVHVLPNKRVGQILTSLWGLGFLGNSLNKHFQRPSCPPTPGEGDGKDFIYVELQFLGSTVPCTVPRKVQLVVQQSPQQGQGQDLCSILQLGPVQPQARFSLSAIVWCPWDHRPPERKQRNAPLQQESQKSRRVQRQEFQLPLSKSLNIQIPSPVSGHAYSGH